MTKQREKVVWYKPLSENERQFCLADLEHLKRMLKKSINKKIEETNAQSAPPPLPEAETEIETT